MRLSLTGTGQSTQLNVNSIEKSLQSKHQYFQLKPLILGDKMMTKIWAFRISGFTAQNVFSFFSVADINN